VQLGPSGQHRLALAVQLHRLLLAEDSAEMAQETEDARPLAPQRAQLVLLSGQVLEAGNRDLVAQPVHAHRP
jgi:hypothetical protein